MRLPHLPSFAKDPLYFITTATHDRRSILSNRASFEILREVWTRSAEIDRWFVGRFIVMPDHIHLFARPAHDAKSLATWIKTWKSISAREISTTSEIPPPIWQRDYFDHFIRSADSYSEKWDYVRNNPVRKTLAVHPDAWPWQGIIHDLSF